MNQITPTPANQDRPRSSLPGAGAGREVTGRRRPLLTAAIGRMSAGGRSLWPVAVRCMAAIVFLIFGVSKFVNHAAELASFRSYPLPAPGTLVYAVGVIEISGGLLLALGLLTRLTALALAADMLGAIVVSGLARWEFVSLTLAPLLLAAMVILIRFGAGDWSLDRHLAANMSRRCAAFLLIFRVPVLGTRRFTCQLVHPVTGEGMSAEDVHRPGDHERYGRNRYLRLPPRHHLRPANQRDDVACSKGKRIGERKVEAARELVDRFACLRVKSVRGTATEEAELMGRARPQSS